MRSKKVILMAALLSACSTDPSSPSEVAGASSNATPPAPPPAVTDIDATVADPPHDAGATDASVIADAADGGPQRFSLSDSLKGSTKGTAVGGTVGANGWTTTSRADRLWYEIPTLAEGSVQFVLSGVTNASLTDNDYDTFALYEAGFGITEPIAYNPQFRENHYKCMLRIYGQAETGRPGQQKLMWGMCPSRAPGFGACTCKSFFEEPFGGSGTWDGTPQTIKIEWKNKVTKLSRNGSVAVTVDWSASGLRFGPEKLHMSLGTARGTAPVGATFSDLVVEGTIGRSTSCSDP